MASLQDQLLNAGLIDTKKAKQMQKDKRKQTNVERRSKEPTVDEAKAAAEAARAEKIARDKALNQERQEQAQQKAIAAQIKQLIEGHSKPKREGKGEVDYHFTDGTKIKKMIVSQMVEKQILNGVLVVAKLGDIYHLVPSVVANKIAQRDNSYLIPVINSTAAATAPDEDDPYKDYVIPDDLMW
ncbi:MAG: DUF2058 domain-containing protein [Marinagarivorans sp.]|nr:DUF2058 domain-containing protein [Marinagarivorans sp.]